MATDATDRAADEANDAPDDDELDRAAEVSDEDIADAVRSWQRDAPARWRDLINARPYED